MKKLLFTALSLGVLALSQAQTASWTQGTNLLYANPSSTTNVGIGTTTPNARLSLGNTGDFTKLNIFDNGANSYAGFGYFGTQTFSNPSVYQNNSNQFRFTIPAATSRFSFLNSSDKNSSEEVFSVNGSGVIAAHLKGYFNTVTTNLNIMGRPNIGFFVNSSTAGYPSHNYAGASPNFELNKDASVTFYQSVWGPRPDNIWTSENGKVITFAQNGQITIGEKRPTAHLATYKLAVDGKLVAKSLYITKPANWADYVFAKEYELKPLSEVEKYIAQNGHLENVPSETQVLENGYEVNEMDATLLRKIEELTLYTIQLKKELDALKAEQSTK